MLPTLLEEFDRVLLLGGNVARAFGFPPAVQLQWLPTRLIRALPDSGVEFAVLPHPSGVNHFYNDPLAASRASLFLHELAHGRPFDQATADPGGCWLFAPAGTRRGGQLDYGRVRVDGCVRLAHRLAFERVAGATAMQVLHRCDTPPCVRPDHLLAGTARDNTHDAIRKRGRRFNARSEACAGCGCHVDARTRGCATCRARHSRRRVRAA